MARESEGRLGVLGILSKKGGIIVQTKGRVWVIFGLLALLVLLCACAKAETVSTPTPMGTMVLPTATPLGAEMKPIPGGSLRLYWTSDLPYWDPNMGAGGQAAANMIHAFVLNHNYGPKYPEWNFDISSDGLADSWEMSPDGLTYTFHLKKGVKWQDKPPVNGRELVAEDVKWSVWNIIKTPAAPRRTQFEEAVQSIDCPDKYTVVFHLKEPRASFLLYMANPYVEILPHESMEEFGDFNSPKAAVGAGPFILEEYTPAVSIVFKKNPTYYRANEGLPYLDGVRFIIIPDASTSLAAFRAANIDIRGIARVDLASVKKTNPDIYCYEAGVSASALQLAMRTDKPPFNDVRVRRALSMALDRQAVIDTFHFGYGIDQQGPIHAASKWYLKDQGECAKYGKYNPDEAKRLLAEAGYPNGFETTLEGTPSWGAEWGEYYIDALADIGIKARIRMHDLGAWYQLCRAKYEALGWLYGWGGATLDPDMWVEGLYAPWSPLDFSAVNDPKLNEMILAQRAALNPEKRQEILNEIQRYDACQRYYVQWPLAYSVTCQQSWVRNYMSHAANYSTGRIYEIVWLDQTSPSRK